MSRTKYSFY